MSILVWFTLGVALWHFTVFVPDRFWGGIVGAFIGSAAGAMVSGAIAQIVSVSLTASRIMPPGMTPPVVIRYNASNVPVAHVSIRNAAFRGDRSYESSIVE